jgi:hypothetical protein
MPICFSIRGMLLYICLLSSSQNMTSAVEIVKPVLQDGIIRPQTVSLMALVRLAVLGYVESLRLLFVSG